MNKLETVEMTTGERIRGCSKATRTATLGSELGMHQVITSEDMIKMKRQKIVSENQTREYIVTVTVYTLEFGFPRLSRRGSEEQAKCIFPATIARTTGENGEVAE